MRDKMVLKSAGALLHTYLSRHLVGQLRWFGRSRRYEPIGNLLVPN